MRLSALAVALVFLCSPVLHGQVLSVYVTSSSKRFSNTQTGIQGKTASFWTSGIGGGATFNFLPVGPVKLGLDVRGSTRSGVGGADTGMAGLRLGFKPPLLRIKPYIQASGGYVATRTANISGGGVIQNKYAAWEILGGLDIPLVPFFDLRLIEIGGGNGYRVPGTTNTPDISLFTINTGLVVHF